jgi:hypothetical protein
MCRLSDMDMSVGFITACNTLRLVSVQLTAQCCIMDADEVYDGSEGTKLKTHRAALLPHANLCARTVRAGNCFFNNAEAICLSNRPGHHGEVHC